MQIWLKLLIYVAMFSIVACQETGPAKPRSVPAGATAIAVPYSYDWDICWVDGSIAANRCRIYNAAGLLMYDDVFLRYEGRGVVAADHLAISQNGGEQWIELKDDTILIPRADYDRIKRNVDWLKGRRPAP